MDAHRWVKTAAEHRENECYSSQKTSPRLESLKFNVLILNDLLECPHIGAERAFCYTRGRGKTWPCHFVPCPEKLG
ncbi:hypothetical protein SBA1_530041 [Candidatus Sulfotelmatobacter kueseliae]|uniref:Uncharacterized protein n=1 Tax=Candidatus Sulfotelmatobacter kueseliae TaxID=2042962 RepID=A0A2U3KXM2_9BACT|nr:hypothetical protein SBA1_530041 [Candidatus Sulfotelmatobacter kueseliae]